MLVTGDAVLSACKHGVASTLHVYSCCLSLMSDPLE